MTEPAMTIPEALRAVVEARPSAIALQDEDRSITFNELQLVTNHLAAELSDRTSEGAPIAIIGEQRAHVAISMLAAGVAGRVSVVLDPNEPSARLAELYQLAGCELLVASRPVSGLAVPLVTPSDLNGWRDEPPVAHVAPDDVAAVYYTSGSTGAPKGAALSHANVVSRALRRVDHGAFRPDDVFGVIVNLAFGYSSGLYVSVLGGFTARLLDLPTLGVAAIRARLRSEPISVIACVPLVLRTITEAVIDDGEPIETIRIVETGGAALQAEEADLVFQAFPRAEIRHLYGSTETGTIAEEILVPNQLRPSGRLRVWNVLPWQSVRVVDEHGAPAAAGESAEVAVSGPGIALGYWRDEPLTRQWFSTNADGLRTARTGDIGRFTDDGMLVLEGRRDDLVKVLGKRVDLAIVTRALNNLSDVDDAVVLAGDNGRLVSYVVPANNTELTIRGLRLALGARLPNYMVPSSFFVLGAIPRTDRGKLDRARLHEISAEASAKRPAYVAPRSETERRLALEFESMLGTDNVGLDDNFLDLGGDSLGVLELLEVVSSEFSIDAHDYLLLESAVHTEASVRELARAVDSAGRGLARDTSTSAPNKDAVLMRPDGVAVLRIASQKAGPASLFLVPGAGEGTVRFLPLANQLHGCTAYAFHRRGYQRRERPDRTVEQMATRLVSAMRSVQETGPYLVGGYSFGTLVAYEMAQQLTAAGEHVALLVLIDPPEPTAQRPRSRRVQRLRSRIMRRLLGKPSASRVARARDLADQSLSAIATYHPQRYNGRVLLVESTLARDTDTPTLWDPLLNGPVERLRLEGTHLAMLNQANSATIAARVDTLIDRVLGAPSSEPPHSRDVGDLDDRGLGPIGRR